MLYRITKKDQEDLEGSLKKLFSSELFLRIAISCLLIPLILFFVLKGFSYIDILSILAIIGMSYEWSKLSLHEFFIPFGITLSVSSILFFLSYLYNFYFFDQIRILFSFLSGAVTAVALFSSRNFFQGAFFLLGNFYIVISMFAFIYVSHKISPGIVAWILILIWVSDSAAYFFGKTFGGIKPFPKISPKKTLSGFAGGIVVPTILSGYLSHILSIENYLNISPYILGFIISVQSHVGDIIESCCKRYFGVKDSGKSIPGHGGFLDRLDSLLFVGLCLWVLIAFKFIAIP